MQREGKEKMREIQIFENATFGKVRTIVIDNEPWFVGKDVATALGYTNPRDALAKHVDEEDRTKGMESRFATPSQESFTSEEDRTKGMEERNVTPSIRDSLGREQYPVLINESGVYSLVFSSKLPTAKAFKRWVTSEILPTIRKTGRYEMPLTPEEEMARGLRAAEKVLARTQLELTQAKQMVSELKPKATYYDLVLQNKSTLSVTKIAKDYGKSAKWMNAKLHDYGVQFKQGDQWFLYQDYAKLGYTQSTTHVIDDEHSRMMTKWTQKGRLFIYETLKAHGILPLIETPLVMDGAGSVQLSE